MYYSEEWQFGRDGKLHRQTAAEVARQSRNRDMGISPKTWTGFWLAVAFIGAIVVWSLAAYGGYRLLTR